MIRRNDQPIFLQHPRKTCVQFKIKKKHFKWESLFSPHWHLLCADGFNPEPSTSFENEIIERLLSYLISASPLNF